MDRKPFGPPVHQYTIVTADTPSFDFNTLLESQGIDPADVLVMRYRPTNPQLRRILPWRAVEDPVTFNAHQQTQTPRAEKAMLNAKYVASFIGHKPACAVFMGLFEIGENRPLDIDQYWSIPAHQKLREFGMAGFKDDERSSILLFELTEQGVFKKWSGRLIVKWPPPEHA